MTRPSTVARLRHLAAVARAAVPIVLAALPLFALSAAAQPLPVARLAYSVKFLCGLGSNDGSLPASAAEMTVIEVHNPHTFPVTITIKWIEDYPVSQISIPPYNVTLNSNQGLNLDCNTLYLPGCPPVCGQVHRGFVEILSPQQLKVVALYKEAMGFPGLTRSVSIAKKSSPFFFFPPYYRHSATFLVGDDVPAGGGDTINHETTVSLVNMGNSPVNANITIMNKTGVVAAFPRLIPVNGFTAVTGADLPPAVPRPFVGGVLVQYNDTGFGVLLECEEIIQKHVISGTRVGGVAMSVVEVQPIPIRP